MYAIIAYSKGVINLNFNLIDRENWERREYFEHYFKSVPCTYSMTVQLDITHLRSSGIRLYPAMLYCLTKEVNRRREFRTAIDSEGRLGYYDNMHPSYTVLRDNETFTNIWTEYDSDFSVFLKSYETDVAKYTPLPGFSAKPDTPENCFNVSMIPWKSFESFNLNLPKGGDYLLPIFTMGRFHEENGRILLPFAAQVHHAVCDGFHLCRFINELSELVNSDASLYS